MDDQVPAEVMDDRLQRLQAALNRDQRAFNRASVGRTCAVLIERAGKLPGQMLGKSPWLQSVHLDRRSRDRRPGPGQAGAAGPNSLAGERPVRAAA